MARLEVKLDFDNVTIVEVSKFRELFFAGKVGRALQVIEPAIVSIDEGVVNREYLDTMGSNGANQLAGVVIRELTAMLQDDSGSDIVTIDLNGWRIKDQDAFAQAAEDSDFNKLNQLIPLVVKRGPGVGQDGKMTAKVQDLSFEQYVAITRAINKEIASGFAEGN